MTKLDPSSSRRRLVCPVAVVTFAVLASGLASLNAQAPIKWSVKDIKDSKTDISTRGKLCIAANLGPEVCEKVVNGVHFSADRAHWTRKILVRNGPVVRGVMYWPEFRSGGFVLKMPYNRAAPASNTNGGIRHSTDKDYDVILRDTRHNPSPNHPTMTVQCTIEGLTAGNSYEIQIFAGNTKITGWATEWDNGVGGRAGKGGIRMTSSGPHGGQVATGTFVATASGKQTFTNYQQPAQGTIKAAWNHCSAVQIRDITPKPFRARATYYGEGTPGTNTQPLLGGSKCSPGIGLSGHPIIRSTVNLTVENSQDVASVAVLAIGATPASIKVFSGELLVTPLALWPLPMPQPKSPYVHDHELQIPLTLPSGPLTIYVQALQLDKGALGGWSFTPGLKIEIGLKP